MLIKIIIGMEKYKMAHTIETLRKDKKLIEDKITQMLNTFEKKFGVKVDYTSYDDGSKFWIEKKIKRGKKRFSFDIDINNN